jgi:hypothetical protein
MRMLMKVQIPTQRASQAIKDGSFEKTMNQVMATIQPEAAYFTVDDGIRTLYVVFDMTDSADMPMIAEPLFMNLEAAIDYWPVMNQDDLKAGLARAAAQF